MTPQDGPQVIKLRGGPLDGQRRSHPLHPALFGEWVGARLEVWARENDQAWVPEDRGVAVYDYQGQMYLNP